MLLGRLLLLAFSAAATKGGTRVGPKYLLLGARNVHSTNATLVLGKVAKHGLPMIKEERGYEMRFDNMQPSPQSGSQ